MYVRTYRAWIYMIWIMFKIKFLSDMSDVFILYVHNNVYKYIIKHRNSFPQKYAGKLINCSSKAHIFFLHCFCTQVRYIRQKKSSVDFYSVFPFRTSKNATHTLLPLSVSVYSRNFLK